METRKINLDFRELSGSHRRNKTTPISLEDVASELHFMQNKNKTVDWSDLDLERRNQNPVGASASIRNDAEFSAQNQSVPENKMARTRAGNPKGNSRVPVKNEGAKPKKTNNSSSVRAFISTQSELHLMFLLLISEQSCMHSISPAG